MTVSLDHATGVSAVRSMVEQHSVVDPYDEPHTVIGLRVIVSRDHLAAAVDMGVHQHYGTYMPRGADDLTVEEIRYFAESFLMSEDVLGLQQAAEAMAQLALEDFHEDVTREHIQACYRAVDRAFPKTVSGLEK
ncbi:hypothetical protein OID55_10875 [Streptomyces sp. NBC_00715]|uniref:hypothetical protein n=1 Tax=Streptomyces sp. NBC_00715 TaxID=2975811 RepID=UPI0038684C50